MNKEKLPPKKEINKFLDNVRKKPENKTINMLKRKMFKMK